MGVVRDRHDERTGEGQQLRTSHEGLRLADEIPPVWCGGLDEALAWAHAADLAWWSTYRTHMGCPLPQNVGACQLILQRIGCAVADGV